MYVRWGIIAQKGQSSQCHVLQGLMLILQAERLRICAQAVTGANTALDMAMKHRQQTAQQVTFVQLMQPVPHPQMAKQVTSVQLDPTARLELPDPSSVRQDPTQQPCRMMRVFHAWQAIIAWMGKPMLIAQQATIALKALVMCGSHVQLAPLVQPQAFRMRQNALNALVASTVTALMPLLSPDLAMLVTTV